MFRFVVTCVRNRGSAGKEIIGKRKAVKGIETENLSKRLVQSLFFTLVLFDLAKYPN